LAGILVLLGLRGALQGLRRTFFGLGGLVAGLVVSTTWWREASWTLAARWGVPQLPANVLAFTLLLLLPYSAFRLLGAVCARVARFGLRPGPDRLSGALLGLLGGGLLLGSLVKALASTGWGGGLVASSRVAGWLHAFFHHAATWFGS
jgi:uncharacterized membrane protein required for colicin V production